MRFFKRMGKNANYSLNYHCSLSTILLVLLFLLLFLNSCNGNSEEVTPLKKASKKCKILTESLLRRYDGEDVQSILNGEIWGESISIPIDWELRNVLDRSIAYQISGLQFLDSLYFASKENINCSSLLLLIHDYIVDFCKNAPSYRNQSEWPWHDDATAFRLIRLSFYYSLYATMYDENEKTIIETCMKDHISLLLSDDFYRYGHNHGMHQDEAVIVYSLLVCDDSNIQMHNLDIALNRTKDYLLQSFTSEGIHKEHSPEYALSAVSDLDRFREMVKEIHPQFIAQTEDIKSKSMDYFIQLTKPDLKYPSVGDSPEIKVNDLSFFSVNQYFKYITSRGKEGLSPDLNKVFPESGYAFFRSSWTENEEDTTWLMFIAASFSHIHKHGDDLSFLLYHGGDLITEAGNRNYNYSDQETSWSYSGYGHNVISIDNETFAPYISDYDVAMQTKITAYALPSTLNEGQSYVEAKEFRFKGVEHTRSITYDCKSNLVIVSDELLCSSEKPFSFFFHVAEGVSVLMIDNGWEFFRAGKMVARLVISGSSNLTLSEYNKDSQEYPWCSWIFNGNTDPKYGVLLRGEAQLSSGLNLFEYRFELY